MSNAAHIVPRHLGMRAVPDTKTIFYAPHDTNFRFLGAIELNGSNNGFTTPSISFYNDVNNRVAITDVRGFLQKSKLRFIMVVYKEFVTTPNNNEALTDASAKVKSVKIKLWRNTGEAAPKVVAQQGITCGTNFIDDCNACSGINGNLCGNCKDTYGKKIPDLQILT